MTRPQHTILAIALIALGRGFLYLPVYEGWGDFPQTLRAVFDQQHVWICGMVWVALGTFGVFCALTEGLPRWVQQLWWAVIIGGISAWGGMYVSSLVLPDPDFRLVAAGELYLGLAYLIWSTTPPDLARRQRRVRPSSSRGK